MYGAYVLLMNDALKAFYEKMVWIVLELSQKEKSLFKVSKLIFYKASKGMTEASLVSTENGANVKCCVWEVCRRRMIEPFGLCGPV